MVSQSVSDKTMKSSGGKKPQISQNTYHGLTDRNVGALFLWALSLMARQKG